MDSIHRRELKYILSERLFRKLKNKLDLFLRPDKNMQNSSYRVRSLYFDTIDDYDLHSSMSGIMNKSKVRLRIYPPNLKDIKLELKQKTNLYGEKSSINIDYNEAQKLLKLQYRFLLNRNDAQAKKIYLHFASRAYVPKVIIEYKRCAYTYPVSNTRITYDYNIQTCTANQSFFKENIFGIHALDKGLGILEIKYDNYLISTIKYILRDIDELQTSNSKYVNSRLLF